MTWQNSQVNIYIYIYIYIYILLLGWSMGKYYVTVTESQKSMTVVTECHVTVTACDKEVS